MATSVRLDDGFVTLARVHAEAENRSLPKLGYSWLEDKIEIYLLQLGTHENFYKKMKGQRKVDLKLLK